MIELNYMQTFIKIHPHIAESVMLPGAQPPKCNFQAKREK